MDNNPKLSEEKYLEKYPVNKMKGYIERFNSRKPNEERNRKFRQLYRSYYKFCKFLKSDIYLNHLHTLAIKFIYLFMMIDLGEKRRKIGKNIRDLTLESCFKKGIPNSDDKYVDKCLVVELRSFLSTMSFDYVAIVRTKSNRPKHVFYHTFQGCLGFRS